MERVVEADRITIHLTLPVDIYEDLLASARVIHEDPHFFVEALIVCYSRDFVKHMMKDC
jgi:hypothetical protein